MSEIWKDIDGFDGYQASNLGRVKSFIFNKINGRILKNVSNSYGYKVVSLINDDGKKSMPVHRLVANAFIDNPLNKITVNHINGIKDDNRVDNLDWNTFEENMNHALVSGIHNNPKKPIIQLTKEGIVIDEFESLNEAKRQTGVENGNISSCARGERSQAGGYKWKFKNI